MTKEDTEKVIRPLQRIEYKNGKPFYVYKCVKCGEETIKQRKVVRGLSLCEK